MRISSLLSKAQCEARNYTFLEKLMMKQQRLRQFLNEENRRRALILRSKLPKKDGLSAQPSKIGSREMFGQSQSTGQKSEHASSLECQTQTGSRKTSQLEKPCKKTRNCRHFLKSHCWRGASCSFRHDPSVFCSHQQKVFLGGLPRHLTSSLLRKRLTEQGYTVLNKPKVLKRYSPQVCLGSVDEAKRLLEKQTIVIDEEVVRVRPYVAFTQDNRKKSSDEVERSVFLGGLTQGTTGEQVHEALKKIDMVVVNDPVLKHRYCRQVVLETVQQAEMLLEMKRIHINGTMVNVRPFACIGRIKRKRKTNM